MKQNIDEYLDSLRGKRVDVLGLGVSNRPLVRLLAEYGVEVTARDMRERRAFGALAEELEAAGVRLRLGDGYLEGLDGDVIFRTPGMHPDKPELKAALARGSVLSSEMEAFFKVCPCRIIAVTGSDGKTTTSSIIAELLMAEGLPVHLGGNIGQPLLAETPSMGPDDWVVLELSSFQLCRMSCRPDIAVITNLSPNHLDIHPDMEDYIESKTMIFRNQGPGDRLVLNRDNELCAAMAKDAAAEVLLFSRKGPVWSGAFLDGEMIYRASQGNVDAILPHTGVLLPGEHNVENYMAAFAATGGIVSDGVCRRVARSFTGVEHRLELARKLRGVSFYNDSIASSPTRTIAGLRSFEKKPILIAGGYDKRIPFDELGAVIVERVKALVLCGDTADKILAAVHAAPSYYTSGLPIRIVDDFETAVRTAADLAGEGDAVLLSPACASFDKFANFAERGNEFKRIVNELE